jgi:hypothetical protein
MLPNKYIFCFIENRKHIPLNVNDIIKNMTNNLIKLAKLVFPYTNLIIIQATANSQGKQANIFNLGITKTSVYNPPMELEIINAIILHLCFIYFIVNVNKKKLTMQFSKIKISA